MKKNSTDILFKGFLSCFSPEPDKATSKWGLYQVAVQVDTKLLHVRANKKPFLLSGVQVQHLGGRANKRLPPDVSAIFTQPIEYQSAIITNQIVVTLNTLNTLISRTTFSFLEIR